MPVLSALLILALMFAAFTVLFWAGTLFIQTYIYTEATPAIRWQAPAAAALMTAFVALWAYLILKAGPTSPGELSYDTLFRFSPKVDMTSEPAKEIWGVKKKGETILNKRHTVQGLGRNPNYVYKDTTVAQQTWPSTGIEEAYLMYKDQKLHFKAEKDPDGGYRRFVSPEGWVMMEYDNGPTGVPTAFRFWRFVINVLLNALHLGMWFICLWLLLRFEWSHALGFAFVLWLIFTLSILPMILTAAGDAART